MYALNNRESLASQAPMKMSVAAAVGGEPARVEPAEPSDIVIGGSPTFWAAKRVFDVVMALLLLPVMAGIALFLLIVNPFLNRGGLLYTQTRMGCGGLSFRIVKFRTMLAAPKNATIA